MRSSHWTKAAIAALCFAAAPATAAGSYPNYQAARSALARGDCDGVVKHLNRFLARHPDLRDRHPEFYLELKLVIGQCSGKIRVRGIEAESAAIGPLPEAVPM